MIEADVMEFPFVAGLPKREKSRVAKAWEAFQAVVQATREHGALVPLSFAAGAIGVSRGRAYQLVEEGKFHVIEIGGQKFVTEESVVAYAKSERKVGRPVKTPESKAEIWRVAREASKEIVSGK